MLFLPTYNSSSLLALFALFALVSGAPQPPVITLERPLNQQFPPPARINQEFSWTISPNTFTSPSLGLKYTAPNLPHFLSFDPATRVIRGTPSGRDAGDYLIAITATTDDGQYASSDTVLLNVSPKQGGVKLNLAIKDQLVANETSITSAFPYTPSSIYYPGARVPPYWSFSLGFEPSTFTAPTRVFYTASQLDGRPLPDWLLFNNQTVTFDGNAPPPPTLDNRAPMFYTIALCASDVFGYTDQMEFFNITIAAHDLAVKNTSPSSMASDGAHRVGQMAAMNLTVGYWTSIQLPFSSLTLDGEELKSDQVEKVIINTDCVDWLKYSAKNMSLYGTPPTELVGDTSKILPVTIKDTYGDILNTTLQLGFYPSAFMSNKAGPIMVNEVVDFDVSKLYTGASSTPLPSLSSREVSNPYSINAEFEPKQASDWLSYTPESNMLKGTIPDKVDYDTVIVQLSAEDKLTHALSHLSLELTLAHNGTKVAAHHAGLPTPAKIGIAVVTSAVGALVLLCLVVMLCRRRQRQRGNHLGSGGGVDEEGYNYEKEGGVGGERGEGDIAGSEYVAPETPAMGYNDTFHEPPSAQQLVPRRSVEVNESDHHGSEPPRGSDEGMIRVEPTSSDQLPPAIEVDSPSTKGRSTLRTFAKNPFAFGKKNTRKLNPGMISHPVIMPSFSNAAFQAQLAAAVDSAGIVKRGSTYVPSDSHNIETSSEFTYDNEHDYQFSSPGSTKPVKSTNVLGTMFTRSDLDSGSRTGTRSTGGTAESDSQFHGMGSSRASWESEPPFVWTSADTPGRAEDAANTTMGTALTGKTTSTKGSSLVSSVITGASYVDGYQSPSASERSVKRSHGQDRVPKMITLEDLVGMTTGADDDFHQLDSDEPIQRSDFRANPAARQPPASASGGLTRPAVRHEIVTPDSGIMTEAGISIDNIHFPTDSDIAHTEASSEHEAVIITTAARVDARRTLDGGTSGRITPQGMRIDGFGSGSNASSPSGSEMTEKGSMSGHHSPGRIMTTHSRLVSFGKGHKSPGGIQAQKVQAQVVVNEHGQRSASQTAVVGTSRSEASGITTSSASHRYLTGTPRQGSPTMPRNAPPPSGISSTESTPREIPQSRRQATSSPSPPTSLPSLPALPSVPAVPSPLTSQRILLGVAEPFHFYPPLSMSPSSSASSAMSASTTAEGKPRVKAGTTYRALVESSGGGTLADLPSWLHFEDMELWGVPEDQDRGVWDIRIVEGKAKKGGEKVVGRFALEVSTDRDHEVMEGR